MKKWYDIVAVLGVALLSGCSEDAGTSLEETLAEGTLVTAVLDVSVSIGASGGMGTRADATYELNGTTAESTIKYLTLFMVGLDENGEEDPTDVASVTKVWTSAVASTCTFTLDTRTGSKHVYVGANLNDSQIAAFKGTATGGLNTAYTSGETTYAGIVEDFATDGSFAMFGQATLADGTSSIGIETPDVTVSIKVDLSRLVAKVLMVVDVDANGYVTLGSGSETVGWAHKDNVRFMLNVLNRKAYLNQKLDGTAVVDPNYSFADLMQENTALGSYSLTTEGTDGFVRGVPEVWKDPESWGMQMEAYDASKLGSTSTDHYTTGLYCPENTMETDFPSSWSLTDDLASSVRRMVVTYAVAAVKTVPRYIIEASGASTDTATDAGTATDAATILQADAADPNNYPDGTFYIYNEQVYSYAGMVEKIRVDTDSPGLSRENFTAYPGGWGYYYTYIDGTKDESTNKLTYSADSGVLRNYYYILHVGKFSFVPPGDGSTKFMEVNTVEKYLWTNAGTGEITLKP